MKQDVFDEAKVLVLVDKNKSTLTALKFQNIQLSKNFIQNLTSIINLAELKELQFVKCNLDFESGSILAGIIPKCPKLSILNFADNQLGKSVQHILKEISTSNIEVMDISGNIIDLNSFKFPKNFNQSKLKILNFQNCRIHNYINKEELNSIFEIQTLEELNLSCANANMNLA